MNGDATLDHLQSLAPGFQDYAYAFVAGWRTQGVPLLVISGRRDAERNQEAGGVPRSLHLDGLAFDVSVWWPGYGHIPRAMIPFWWWEALARPWEQAGGRWGGRFNTLDVNHFDVGAPNRF